jgi:hypothetical protein
MEAKIAELKENEERYKEFIRMHESMNKRLKEENEDLRKKNSELEASIRKLEEIMHENRQREISNYDKFMISFKKASD